MAAKQPSAADIKSLVRKELPKLVKQDAAIRALVIELGEKKFADKKLTEDRFDKMLAELARDREENNKRWQEAKQRWEESNRSWNQRWEENNKRWEENTRLWNQRWEENDKRWEENTRLWNQRWEETSRQINATLQELAKFQSRFDQSIGAIGARWGRNSEVAFREALAAILQKNTDLKVMHFVEFDEQGLVFDRPDQVEIDVIIKNGTTILVEIKSYVSKADITVFLRKAHYYEKKHQKPKELIIITPQILPEVLLFAKESGITVFSYAEEARQYLSQ